MRTGVELQQQPRDSLEELEEKIRYVGADLMQATRGLPPPDQVPYLDRQVLIDIHWNIAEALRLNVEYRRRLAARLAGSTTPAQGSSPQSLHDPPSTHVTPGAPEETGEPYTP